MAARRGLNKGHGLESLIPQRIKQDETGDAAGKESSISEVHDSGVSEKGQTKKTAQNKNDANTNPEDFIKRIKVSQIVPNHEQPRKQFDEETLQELADSIRQYGVLQPILVKKKGRYYEIIAGERRWRAAKEAGLKEVPVVIRQFTSQETMEISLIENIQREDLNPIEEAEAYQILMREFSLTQEEVAKKVGKSRAAVANTLRLLNLSESVRALLVTGQISMGHARAFLAIDNPETQAEAARTVIERKMSVRETEDYVKKILHPSERKKRTKQDEQTRLAYKELEDRITNKIGSKTIIHAHGNKGKIEIDYYSQEDLERIIDLIG